jgi:phospholipid-binding lipoprotein MlaA
VLCALLLAAPAAAEDGEGALDGFNRANRRFNFWLLDHVFEPVSRGYNFVMPKWGQERVHNLLENLERPRDFVNSLLQGKPARAGRHLGAFLVDSTVGLAGMFTVSERLLTLESPETFGETLGAWGLPPGAYLILPVYGDTCPRCLVGAAGDAVLYPLFWIPGSAGTWASLGARTLEGMNLLAQQMPPRGASEQEWAAYRGRLESRTPYPEAKSLFFENLAFDVED